MISLRPTLRRLLALAGLAAREALRGRLVLSVLVAVAAALAALAWGATGDGTAAGRLRAYLSWGTTWIGLTLSLVAAFLPSSLAVALKDGRLIPVTTGPLPRQLVPVAWWLGQVAVLLGLALVTHAGLFGLALALRATTPEAERAGLEPVLEARVLVRPDPTVHASTGEPMDRKWIEAQAAAQALKLEKAGALADLGPGGFEEVAAELADQLSTRLRTAPPGGLLRWSFSGVEPAPGARAVALRFQYAARDVRGALPPGQGPRGVFSLHTPTTSSDLPVRASAGSVHEQLVPVAYLDGSTRVVVEYANRDPRQVVVTFPEDGVAFLYPAGGGFLLNVARAALVLAGRLALLLAVGVAAAALIDGKLASLMTLSVLAVCSGHEFLRDAVSQDALSPMSLVLWILPDLGHDDLSGALAAGLAIPWASVGVYGLVHGLVVGGVVVLVGALLFGLRELGSIR